MQPDTWTHHAASIAASLRSRLASHLVIIEHPEQSDESTAEHSYMTTFDPALSSLQERLTDGVHGLFAVGERAACYIVTVWAWQGWIWRIVGPASDLQPRGSAHPGSLGLIRAQHARRIRVPSTPQSKRWKALG